MIMESEKYDCQKIFQKILEKKDFTNIMYK